MLDHLPTVEILILLKAFCFQRPGKPELPARITTSICLMGSMVWVALSGFPFSREFHNRDLIFGAASDPGLPSWARILRPFGTLGILGWGAHGLSDFLACRID